VDAPSSTSQTAPIWKRHTEQIQRINPPMQRLETSQPEVLEPMSAEPTVAERAAPSATRSSPALVEGSPNAASPQPRRSHRTTPAVAETAVPLATGSSPALIEGSVNAASPQPRRSHRTIKPPMWLNDYDCSESLEGEE
jgi:hypothetical protein